MAGTAEACILFLYHRNDPVTFHHYEILLQTGYPVVPLVSGTGGYLPDTCDVSTLDSGGAWGTGGKTWASIDTWVYRWFEHRTITARRYIIAEWDCLLIGDIRQYYGARWGDEFVCNYLKRAGDDWYWFRRTPRAVPDRLNAGVVPLAGCLLSHDAMDRIVDTSRDPMLRNVFCENRIGIAAGLAGVSITALRKDGTLNASRKRLYPRRQGFYHAVKALPPGMAPAPGAKDWT